MSLEEFAAKITKAYQNNGRPNTNEYLAASRAACEEANYHWAIR